ncbi:hypothetical protein CEUSTIGMA_g2763.t1 [Chlamydomonas eustigma]|uniref:GRF-type domain-containing protein n=1 Tax=Chlamydomonas eustigma TaxID=1157962 RepID=A0A250WWV1_9CHLO|nr:hypothetical protein CEUSTIGMA_g2763.t1 [Chlamydomonas eustigma]|eukprot:GAX75318.1 hypothetical protein CEUSTIGMA_g2763.t1 [Chlamydomonas eustigma]
MLPLKRKDSSCSSHNVQPSTSLHVGKRQALMQGYCVDSSSTRTLRTPAATVKVSGGDILCHGHISEAECDTSDPVDPVDCTDPSHYPRGHRVTASFNPQQRSAIIAWPADGQRCSTAVLPDGQHCSTAVLPDGQRCCTAVLPDEPCLPTSQQQSMHHLHLPSTSLQQGHGTACIQQHHYLPSTSVLQGHGTACIQQQRQQKQHMLSASQPSEADHYFASCTDRPPGIRRLSTLQATMSSRDEMTSNHSMMPQEIHPPSMSDRSIPPSLGSSLRFSITLGDKGKGMMKPLLPMLSAMPSTTSLLPSHNATIIPQYASLLPPVGMPTRSLLHDNSIPSNQPGMPLLTPPAACCPTHGRGSVQLKRTHKTGPNNGRIFFTCKVRDCPYFKWADTGFPRCICLQGGNAPLGARDHTLFGSEHDGASFSSRHNLVEKSSCSSSNSSCHHQDSIAGSAEVRLGAAGVTVPLQKRRLCVLKVSKKEHSGGKWFFACALGDLGAGREGAQGDLERNHDRGCSSLVGGNAQSTSLGCTYFSWATEEQLRGLKLHLSPLL